MKIAPAPVQIAYRDEMRLVDGFVTDVAGVNVVPYQDVPGRWALSLEYSGLLIPPATFASPELAAEFLERIAGLTDWTRPQDEIGNDGDLARRVAIAWRTWRTEGM